MLFNKSMSLTGLALLIVLSIVICSVISLGWFGNNTSGTTATGMQATAKEDHFELAVSGSQALPYDNSSPIVTYLNSNEGGNYYKLASTDRSNTSILCHVTNENPHILGSEEIAPGAYGQISFDIVTDVGAPLVNYDISLEFLPFGKVGNTPVPVSNLIIDDIKEVLNGHFLIFSSRSVLINGGYYYSDRIEGKNFVFDPSEHTPVTRADGVHYTVNLYWIWPGTFAQLALASTSPKLHAHPVFQTELERQDILDYIALNRSEFFLNVSPSINFSRAGFEEYYFVELSEEYNNADQLIGDNANILVIRFTVNAIS